MGEKLAAVRRHVEILNRTAVEREDKCGTAEVAPLLQIHRHTGQSPAAVGQIEELSAIATPGWLRPATCRDHRLSAAVVERLKEAAATGRRGVAGLAGTLKALSERRAERLLVSKGYTEQEFAVLADFFSGQKRQ